MRHLVLGVLLGLMGGAYPALAIEPFTQLQTEDGDHEGYNYNGIIKLSNCSASLVQFKGADPQRRALVLTNGHCIGMGSFMGRFPNLGEMAYYKQNERQVSFLDETGDEIVYETNTYQIIYATMTSTDLALYELNETYAELEDTYGIHARVLADQMPLLAEPIEVVSGYWQRGFSCAIDGIVSTLVEGPWIWNSSIRYSDPGCVVYGGTSGSPVISQVTGEVIGVNNTGNEGSGEDCSLMNPCEVDDEGNTSVYRLGGYGQQTYLLYTCLNENYEFDLDREGCRLPKGKEL